jgi:hypothetical protein
MPGFLTKLVYAFLTSPYMIGIVHLTQIILEKMYEHDASSYVIFPFLSLTVHQSTHNPCTALLCSQTPPIRVLPLN